MPAGKRQRELGASGASLAGTFYRARNLWISDADGTNESAITTDGSEKDRIKNGKASWVYGEELNQNTAFWWSPDGNKLLAARVDNGPVQRWWIADPANPEQAPTEIAYPRAGSANAEIPMGSPPRYLKPKDNPDLISINSNNLLQATPRNVTM